MQPAVRGGVRTIEDGNLVDAPTARLIAERRAYLVPTLVAYDSLNESNRQAPPGEHGARMSSLE